ncbi:MAG TPA: amidohydrolase family protein [Candidatus Binataceae bacterium]|nr:amidohydrolase family protein [Candidatus Binataceae bacterium]
MEYHLISADSHANPPPTMWRDYIGAEFRERAPRMESTAEGDFQVFEGRRTPILGINAMAGKRFEDYSLTVRRLSEQRPGGWDPAERLKDQDLDGVQAEVLYGGGPLATQDSALRRASHIAYNDWLADFCSVNPKRLLGMAYIPFDSVEGALTEIRRTARKGLAGAVIPRFPPGGGNWFDPRWEPLWDTLVDAGWPAGVHVGGRGREMAMPSTDSTGFLADLLMSKFAMGEAISILVLSGILERHPNLSVISVEGQIGWMSFAHYYLDHLWERHRYWTKSALKEPPSYYFRRQVYATFMEDPVGLRECHHIGIDKIMWSSDYPHSETTWPKSKELTEDWFKDFDAGDRAKICAGNAQRLYNL